MKIGTQFRRKRLILCLGISIIYMIASTMLFGHWYIINDDVTIMNILSGIYSGSCDPHVYGVQYPLTFILSFMYKIYDKVDWFGYFLVAINCVCLFAILYRVFEITQTLHERKIIFGTTLAVFVLLDFFVITYVSFTTTANIAGITAIFLVLTEEWEKPFIKRWTSILFLVLSFMLRKECCLMLLPFFGVGLLLELLRDRNVEKIKKLGEYSLCLGAVLGIVALTHCIHYSSTEWKDYLRFRSARKTVHDYYGYPSWEGNENFYKGIGKNGISESEYLCLRNGVVNTTLDYSEDTVTILESVGAYGKATVSDMSINNKFELALMRIKDMLISTYCKNIARWLCIIGVVVCIFLFKIKEKTFFGIYVLGMLGLMAECIILSYKGRLPAYNVGQNIFIIGGFWSLAFFIKGMNNKIVSRIDKFGLIVLLFFTFVFGYKNLESIRNEKAKYIENERQSMVVNEYCKARPENVYFSPASFFSNITSNIVECLDTTLDNRIILGGWNAFSPVYYDKLDALRLIGTPEEALIYQDNVFLMSTEVGLWPIDNYLRDKYGEKYDIEIIDSVELSKDNYFNIYKIKVT